jgi:hypothetical protein
MPGPPPKHQSARARRNKATTRAILTVPVPVDYSAWTAKELRDEIDRRNGDRDEDEQLPRSGTKARMAERLAVDDLVEIPELPTRPAGWSDVARNWWTSVWSSPMQSEWHPETDYYNVLAAVGHLDDWWNAETAHERQKADTLFMKRVVPLGLDPLARRRLEWQIEVTEGAKAQGQRRRDQQPATPPPAPKRGSDPRAALSLVQ